VKAEVSPKKESEPAGKNINDKKEDDKKVAEVAGKAVEVADDGKKKEADEVPEGGANPIIEPEKAIEDKQKSPEKPAEG
jgi:hypothetical protein